MKDIPIDQMDIGRLRVELSSALIANQVLIGQQKAWGKDQLFHYCPKGLKPYPRFLCSVCPPGPLDGSEDFNAYERLMELKVENARLTEREQVLDALEAAGVDNWQGYDYAMELLAEEENGT